MPKNPLRVLIPIGHNQLGGAQRSLIRFLKAVPSEQLSARLVYPGDEPLNSQFEAAGFDHQTIGASFWSWSTLKFLKHEMKKVDLVATYAPRIVSLQAKWFGVPCVERINMSRHPQVGGKAGHPLLDRWITGLNSGLVCVSQALADQLIRRGLPEHKIKVVVNGIDTNIFTAPNHPSASTDKIIINIGRLHPQKGQDILIQAFSKLLGKHPSLQLKIYGEGPQRHDLETLAQNLGCKAQVQFMGDQEIDKSVYHQATLFCQSSRWEPLSNALLEAAACACPIVATDVDGSSEVIRHQEHGWLVPPDDVPALASALEQALNAPDQAVAFGQAARQRVQQDFSIESWVDHTLEAWHHFAGRKA